MSDSTDPKQWFRRAEQDLRSAANNLADDPSLLSEVICYESHQACEKALKGFLLARGQVPPRTHDLPALLSECCEYAPSLEEHRNRLLQLNEYSLDARYPGDFIDAFTQGDAKAAYEDALLVLNALLDLAGYSS